MNQASRIYHNHQSFLRSSLESSPTDIEPKPFAPFHALRPNDRTHTQLHQLKRKLLRTVLEETPDSGSFKQLCGAANQAAELAWATSHPLLVFPHLFDEMVEAVREARFQQEQVSDAQFPHASLDTDLRFENIHSVSRGPDPISTRGVSGCVAQTQPMAIAAPTRRHGCHPSNQANHAIQPRGSRNKKS